MKKNKILSIIIPTYNMEKYLRKCLESLMVSEANLNLLEVLVVNDGSKDASSIIGHEYENAYPQTFRVIDKENGNYGSCVNRGLAEATGKYVKILDSDDYFDTEEFNQYLSFLQSCDVDMVLTDYNEVNEKGKVTKQHLVPYPSQQIMFAKSYNDNYFAKELQMHAVTYRLELLKKNNYLQTEGVSYTDQEWVFMPITYMESFCHFQCLLYQYLIGRDGQTIDVSVSSKQVDVRFNLIYKRIKTFTQENNAGGLSNEKIEFLKKRLVFSIFALYRNSLIKDEIQVGKICEFDERIKELSNYIYDEVSISDMCRFKGYSFIGYWREHHRLPLKVKILKHIYKISKNCLYSLRNKNFVG